MADETTPFLPAHFPGPESAARCKDPVGTEVTLADGRVWALADYIPADGPVWDRLYDGNLLAGRYQVDDVLLGASRLLMEHYDLTPDFVGWLLVGADLDDLVRAVEGALFGPRHEYRGYSHWEQAALLANGIDPATVPRPMRRAVLGHLVAAGRVVPHSEYTSAGKGAAKRAGIMAQFEQAAELRRLAPGSATDAPPPG